MMTIKEEEDERQVIKKYHKFQFQEWHVRWKTRKDIFGFFQPKIALTYFLLSE